MSIIKPEDITIEDIRSLGKDSFLMWAITSGVEVDNNKMDFNNHRYLIPLYMDDTDTIVWRKAAQLGATVFMLLKILWWLKANPGRKAGLYFPTKEGVENLSKDRLTPLIASAPDISKITREGDKLGLRRIGTSSFYLYHLGGVASKDSVPLDMVAFDEVRLCSPAEIDQALHRLSHSPFKQKLFVSTSGLPNADIDARFQRGKQYRWTTKCGCKEGIILEDHFPDCVISNDPRRSNEVYLRCPKCHYEIKDPQNGRYVSHNPGGDYNSYSVSQLVSKYRTTKDVWEEYLHTTNMEEFYNAALGLPYIDSTNRGVTKEQLESCINPELKWLKDVPMRDRVGKTAMGIDQGGAYCMVVIADIDPDGTKKRIRHVEIIDQNNPEYYKNNEQVSPFVRCSELIDEFNVGLCVCDMMPNFNESLAFAQKHPRKVFLAHYSEAKDVVQWADRGKVKASIAKAGPVLKFKYQAVMGRYTSLSFALGEWANNNVEIPPLEGLRQMARSEEQKGLLLPEAPANRLFSHLPRLIKAWRVTNDEEGTGRWWFRYAGGDPHLAHAWNYCNVALERLRRHNTFTFA